MILIALGSNLPSCAGPPAETVTGALTALNANGIRLLTVSSLYQTEAWPDPEEPRFINAAALVDTDEDPKALLDKLHRIEQAFGRKRGARNAPRTLDLDLLEYEGRVEQGPPTLPHPGIGSRLFVLIPLAEIVPRWLHPLTGRTPAQMIASLPCPAAGVKRLAPPPLLR